MPKLVVIKGSLKGQVFDLGNRDIVFCGRTPWMNDISILEIAVSRKHFKIFRIGQDLFVEDLKSKHGTRINGKLIEPGEGFQIGEGDIITAGNTVMRLTEVTGRGSLLRTKSMTQNIERRSSYEQPKKERRSAKELELIYNVSELLKKQMSIKNFFEKFLKLLFEVLPRVDNMSIFLFENKKNNTIKITECITDSNENSTPKYNKKILKRVIRERKTIRMSNTDFDPTGDHVEKDETLKIKSVLCVPIVTGDDILGAIYIASRKPYSFRKKDQLLLNSLVGPMAVAIQKNRLLSNS